MSRTAWSWILVSVWNSAVAGDCDSAPVNAIWQEAPAGNLDSTALPEGPHEYLFEDGHGTIPAGDLFGAIVYHVGESAIHGWSLSASVSGDVVVTGGTTEGTHVDVIRPPSPAHGCSGFTFEKTEMVDPQLDDQGQGVVSAVVLCLEQYLRRSGTATVLRVTVEPAAPLDPSPQFGRAVWRDGLEGVGQPVDNLVTVEELLPGSTPFCYTQEAHITFRGITPDDFIRCDANQESGLNVGDAVFTLNWLFRDGPAPQCENAVDCNDDGLLDASDAIFGLQFLFLGGSLPPSPYPACGRDPTGEGLKCEAFDFCDAP